MGFKMRKGIGPKGLGVSPLKQKEEIKPIELDEVVVNAVDRNKLTPDERKVYSKFYRGRNMQKFKNPNYDRSQPPGPKNQLYIKLKNPEYIRDRGFKNYQTIYHDRKRFEMDAYNAIKMFRDSKANYSEKPSFSSRFAPKKFKLKKSDPNKFRGHAGLNTIYVSPKSNINTVVAELAHVFPGMKKNMSIAGTLSRIARGVNERKIPDESNYKSSADFEYKTHTGPNSVERKLLEKYGRVYKK